MCTEKCRVYKYFEHYDILIEDTLKAIEVLDDEQEKNNIEQILKNNLKIVKKRNADG